MMIFFLITDYVDLSELTSTAVISLAGVSGIGAEGAGKIFFCNFRIVIFPFLVFFTKKY